MLNCEVPLYPCINRFRSVSVYASICTRTCPPLFFEPAPPGTTPGPRPPGPRSVFRLFRGCTYIYIYISN